MQNIIIRVERIILQDNLQQLANFLVEKKEEYDFIIPKMKLNRNDNLELREKILSMTSDERKYLGINKSHDEVRQYILEKKGLTLETTLVL